MQGSSFVKPLWPARILLRLTLFCTASLVILLCLWIKMVTTNCASVFIVRSKDFLHNACYMTIQLPFWEKILQSFLSMQGLYDGGMSYMVIGGVTLGCTKYQTRWHNVVGIIENRFEWTLESHSHTRDIFSVPLRKSLLRVSSAFF